MAPTLTREHVLSLAPDAASAKAAGGLTADAKWVSLGADDEAVWGECQGSGAKPYQAQVERAALVSRCSCPSRKFPCKHGLALLLIFVAGNPRFAAQARPAWVEEWLTSRRQRAERKEKTAETTASAPADPATAVAAAEKRGAARWTRIEAGTTELSRWIGDLLRRGLGKFDAEQRREAGALVARMVDAQAPGLAPRIEALLNSLAARAARAEESLGRIGLLQLACEAVRRRDTLGTARRADLQQALGWSPDKDDVVANGESLADHWRVTGQWVDEVDTRLSERRVWLRGSHSGRVALLLDFSYGGRTFERHWRTDTVYPATLAFYPGTVPLRAVETVPHDRIAAAPCPSADPAADNDAALDAAAAAFAANPWLPLFPLILGDARLLRDPERWLVAVPQGRVDLRLEEDAGWSLMAYAGGHPLTVMGEWDGAELRLLTAWNGVDSAWHRSAVR